MNKTVSHENKDELEIRRAVYQSHFTLLNNKDKNPIKNKDRRTLQWHKNTTKK